MLDAFETAALLEDHITEDLAALYPAEARAARVVIISTTDDLLSSYDKKISDVTRLVLDQSGVQVRVDGRFFVRPLSSSMLTPELASPPTPGSSSSRTPGPSSPSSRTLTPGPSCHRHGDSQ